MCPSSHNLTISPPVSLGYLASCLAESGWRVRIFDFKLTGTDRAALFQELVEWGPDLAGISSMTIEMPFAMRLAKQVKKRLPGVPLVFGGVHPSALPEETIKETGADFVVRGEGENSFTRLAQALQRGDTEFHNLPGICFINGDGFVATPDEPMVDDLDTLPMPAWELIPPQKYSDHPWQLFKRRDVVAPILTSRGCPFRCSYCASSKVHGRKLRLRSPQSVVQEMQMLISDFSVGEFQIIDDNLTISKQHALDFCREIQANGLDIVWKMPNGIVTDTVDEELARALKEAGCYELGLAIESASPKILDKAHKKVDIPKVRERIRILKKHGIDVYGFFMLGMPGETHETINKTIRFMNAGFDFISVSFCVPYPGSELYDEFFIKKGVKPEWDDLIHFHPFPEMSHLSENELRYYMRRAVFGFYLHPRRLLRILKRITSINPGYTLRLIGKYLGRASNDK